MELLLNIDKHEGKMGSDEFTLTEYDKEDIIKDSDLGSNVKSIEYVNIGAGADCMVVMVGLALVGYKILKSSKSINDGIDGWLINREFYLYLQRNRY